MKQSICLFFLGLISILPAKAQDLTRVPFAIGESVTFESNILHEKRTLNIYLPLGYSPDSAKTYPVIYLLDGSADEDIIHIAGLVQFCSFPWINTLPETIVVGIANVDRQRDFTFPAQSEQYKTDFPTTGHSAEFVACLEQEIMPLMEKNYKLSGKKSLIGQSLGGLLATQILCTKTNLFDTYFIISPSLWWDDESLLTKVTSLNLAEKTIYLAVGDEGKLMVEPAKKLFKLLNAQKTSSTKVFFEYFNNKNHGDMLHQAIYNGFLTIQKSSE